MSQEEVEITIILEKHFFLNIGHDTHLLYWSLPGNKAVFDVAMSGNEEKISCKCQHRANGWLTWVGVDVPGAVTVLSCLVTF